MSRIRCHELTCGLVAALLLSACPASRGDEPDLAPPAYPPFEGSAPGRAARVVLVAGELFMAAIDPATGALVAGPVGLDGEAELVQLDTLDRAPVKRLALTSRDAQVAVAWVDSAGQLKLATRRLGASATEWEVEVVAASADAPFVFKPSEELALGLGARGEQYILTHDPARRGLVALRRIVGSTWRLEIVDDGLGSGLESCPVELRQTRREGLGFMPALHIQGDEVVAAYHDADCGDLRVARRGEARWLVTVVDTGDDLSAQPSEGVTGRFPSLALSPQGALAISYQDASRGRLMFAAIEAEVITRQVVDAGTILDQQGKRRREVVGAFTTTSFDRQGRLVVSYFNATQTTVQVVRGLDSPGAQPIRFSSPSVVLGDQVLAGFHATHFYDQDGGLIFAAERLDVSSGGLLSSLALREEGP